MDGRAISSLPVPVSPSRSTVASRGGDLLGLGEDVPKGGAAAENPGVPVQELQVLAQRDVLRFHPLLERLDCLERLAQRFVGGPAAQGVGEDLCDQVQALDESSGHCRVGCDGPKRERAHALPPTMRGKHTHDCVPTRRKVSLSVAASAGNSSTELN